MFDGTPELLDDDGPSVAPSSKVSVAIESLE